jgi:lipoprotein-anchoring transpeptidase ErfK/SrfK
MINKLVKYSTITPMLVYGSFCGCDDAIIKDLVSQKKQETYVNEQFADTITNVNKWLVNADNNADNLFLLNKLNTNLENINPNVTSIDLLLDVHNKNTKNLRSLVKDKIYGNCGAYVFGVQLDTIVKKIETSYNSTIKLDSTIAKTEQKYSIDIPNIFKQKNIDFYFIASKKDLTLKMYAAKNDELLFDTKIAVGRGKNGGKFDTPTGTFYIKRVIQNPWYYPPEWSSNRTPERPGRSNSYGLWMAELCKDSVSSGYDFGPNGDTGIRIHSTNNPRSIGSKTSHGCIRIHPDVAPEIFRAVLEYSNHKVAKKNGRGTISPLDKSIKITIVE